MLSVKNRSLFFAGFAIVIFKQPLQYLLGDLQLPILAAGIGLCVLASFFILNKFRFKKEDVLLQFLFAAIFILHCLLAFFGVTANRSLWFSGLAQFLVVILFLHYRKDEGAWRFLKKIAFAIIFVECALAFLQLSYYSTGVGLPPVFDEYESYSLVSGSYFNSNDFAVFAAAFSMLLYCICVLEEKEGYGIALLGVAMMAVFVSLSRTAFVFMSLFAIAVLFGSFKNIASSPKKNRSLTGLIAIALTFLAVLYLLGSEFLTSTSVFERSLSRLDQVSVEGLSTDESASDRMLVYRRLWENLPNLGIGSFQDQYYSAYFKPGDYSLMQINPHSFVAEFFFLYGWIGGLIAVCLIFILSLKILRNRDLPLTIRVVIVVSLVFFQSISSSTLANASFFIPFILIAYVRKDLVRSRIYGLPVLDRAGG
ncbi:O-antigen ligase family protein [Variovorax sp. CY25R-8]|uniref:O-antigen ligase family protein n=1 Tax=Variovorax sp. CY25R-8 TaxID=2855501 RepID=UPI0021BB3D61|nr:O-antigen ligase family protein [Variovorax sp. CY25R-8]MCT8175250.1 O-antigen ligase family protein [Variovorax sp. CY25R-8]